jgi:hypothetical protein
VLTPQDRLRKELISIAILLIGFLLGVLEACLDSPDEGTAIIFLSFIA